MKKFEKGFLVGASTAAHQVEGNNIHSDLWAMEHMKHTTYAEPSLDADDEYHRYEEDIRLLAGAGLNAYRFSIEWARIEPEEDCFDMEEIEHYRKVLRCCRENNIEPIVTLHHFSSPAWLMGKGGWEADTTAEDFAEYVKVVMENLGSEMNYVCTINEANMGVQIMAVVRQMLQERGLEQDGGNSTGQSLDGTVQMGVDIKKLMMGSPEKQKENTEVFGVPDPATFQLPRTAHGDEIIQEAHRKARSVIRKICPHVKVGWTLSLFDIQALPGGEKAAREAWEEEFLHYLPVMEEDDFIGVQNYTRALYDKNGSVPAAEDAEKTQMGYEFYPQGLAEVIRRVAREFHGDILVTENGIATSDDCRRIAFIDTAVAGVQKCIEEGIPVRAYMHWSLLDNFEWQKGYSMTFGLIAVDRTTQKRMPKPSLSHLGDYCSGLELNRENLPGKGRVSWNIKK